MKSSGKFSQLLNKRKHIMNINQFEGLLRRTIAILEVHNSDPAAQSVVEELRSLLSDRPYTRTADGTIRLDSDSSTGIYKVSRKD